GRGGGQGRGPSAADDRSAHRRQARTHRAAWRQARDGRSGSGGVGLDKRPPRTHGEAGEFVGLDGLDWRRAERDPQSPSRQSSGWTVPAGGGRPRFDSRTEEAEAGNSGPQKAQGPAVRAPGAPERRAQTLASPG